jgi:hypothetical protein
MMGDALSSDAPSLGIASNDRKAPRLRPSTVGVLKQALSWYLQWEREFVEVYFPRVTARGYVTWGDVFAIGDAQADALRPIMVESIHHFWKLDGRERNRNVNLLTHEPEDPRFVSFYARKAEYWTGALRDLCSTFDLKSPI